jgi:hypothetical protein
MRNAEGQLTRRLLSLERRRLVPQLGLDPELSSSPIDPTGDSDVHDGNGEKRQQMTGRKREHLMVSFCVQEHRTHR